MAMGPGNDMFDSTRIIGQNIYLKARVSDILLLRMCVIAVITGMRVHLSNFLAPVFVNVCRFKLLQSL